MLLGAVVGYMVAAVPLIILAGIHIGALTFDISLSDVTVRFIAVFSVLIPLLISIDLPLNMVGIAGIGASYLFGLHSIPIGIGLLTNMYNIFLINDMWGIGIILTSIIGMLMLVSALLISIEGGG